MRTWARENGYEVADRGRLPAEVIDAYRAANGGAAKKKAAPAKKAAVTRAPAKKATVKNVAAEQAATARPSAAPAAPAPVAEDAPTPRPKPSPVEDDRRLVALGEEIKALTLRVEALEKAAGGPKAGSGKASRFRRRS
ncbi:MAG: Lsr2 [Frankiales bacterium]|nr:Lsr2 [Frankiales bacterium]